MSKLVNQIPPLERSNPGEQNHDKASAQAAINRLAAAEQRLRITLEHSVNPPMQFDFSAEEACLLRGRTLSETIEKICKRADPFVAESIRQILTDPAALVEVGNQPARLSERIDQYLE